MITPNSGIASFHAPNRNKLTVPPEPLNKNVITYLTILRPRQGAPRCPCRDVGWIIPIM